MKGIKDTLIAAIVSKDNLYIPSSYIAIRAKKDLRKLRLDTLTYLANFRSK